MASLRDEEDLIIELNCYGLRKDKRYEAKTKNSKPS